MVESFAEIKKAVAETAKAAEKKAAPAKEAVKEEAPKKEVAPKKTAPVKKTAPAKKTEEKKPAEFDYGNMSGWTYSVNGEFPNVSCSAYKLSEGDYVRWIYTDDGKVGQ